MGTLIKAAFSWMADYLAYALQWWVDLFVSLINEWWAGVLTIAEAMWQHGLNMMPPEVAAWFNSTPWQPYLEHIDTFNWFVPIYPAMALALGAYGLAAAIRLVRWILGINILGFSGGS